MEPENPTPAPDASNSGTDMGDASAQAPDAMMAAPETRTAPPDGPGPETAGRHWLHWVFIGPQGLRAGWSVAIFLVIMIALVSSLDFLLARAHLVDLKNQFAPKSVFFGELAGFVGLLAAAWLTALIERRHILDYNLRGPRRAAHFLQGMVVGFAALSVLLGALEWGGWLHFGPVALSGRQILLYAALWGVTFLMVGCVEEGMMRCFLLYTLTRGVNFWWAAGLVACMCGDLLWRAKGNGVWGVYVMALAGVVPCLILQLKKAPSTGFWNATWLTSMFFGFGHTANGGENWIGIFAAAGIGVVFCVSVRVTGSAWWAIGCHAAWDWAETYFYGTADSGLVAKGHLFTTSPAGNALWSGGTDGPEGSVLVIPTMVLILIALLVMYGRRRAAQAPAMAAEQAAG